MRPTLRLLAQHRTPLIKFVGKRKAPQQVDHTPAPHPASPTHSLPDSFENYRSRATQHGPMGRSSAPASASSSSSVPESISSSAPTSGSMTYGVIGGKAGRSLGSIKPKEGEFFDRSELPRRFRKLEFTEAEMEAVESGGASMW